MIESAHDSSSGIASDDHTSSPTGHTTCGSDATYGLPAARPPPSPPQRFPADMVLGDRRAAGDFPNPAFRDVSPRVTGHFRRNAEREHALSPRARLPTSRGAVTTPRCAPEVTDGGRNRGTFSPLTTEEVILNQKNMFPYVNRPGTDHHSHRHLVQHPLISPRPPAPRAARPPRPACPFAALPDDVVLRVLGGLNSRQLCGAARVSRRWYRLVWDPALWTTIRLAGGATDADRALRALTRRLSYDTPSVCVMVERVLLSGCTRLTDKGMHTIARRCPELLHLELQNCANVTNMAVFEVVSKCVNLEHLNVSGCPEVTCICLTPEATVQAPAYGRHIYLRHLDMTDCSGLEDSGLQIVASYCPQLVFLYLRRCLRITDLGVQYVANYCTDIREFSISDCRKVTDFGMRELAKLGANLRYLSVAKCDQVSDLGVRYVAQRCHKLRYLNVRGCEAVSDEAIELVAKFCKRLKSLDIGKCDVTDSGLQVVAEHCPQLRRLSLKSCDAVTDRGVTALAFYCRQLQQLNIQECQVSVESYRAVKKYCRRCIIEHTNPGFY